MPKEKIAAAVIALAELSLGKNPHELTLEKSLRRDLGVDSLDSLELVMRIEDEFNVQFDGEVASKIDTLGDLVSYITAAQTPQTTNI
ncbi:acyl carrier protein [Achromobacter sp. AGC39]